MCQPHNGLEELINRSEWLSSIVCVSFISSLTEEAGKKGGEEGGGRGGGNNKH